MTHRLGRRPGQGLGDRGRPGRRGGLHVAGGRGRVRSVQVGGGDPAGCHAAGRDRGGHQLGRSRPPGLGQEPGVAGVAPGRRSARVPGAVVPGPCGRNARAIAADGGTGVSPASSRSAGISPASCPPQRRHARMCRAIRLRHSGLGTPSQSAVVNSRPGHGGPARSARTTTRQVVSWSFIRPMRTATSVAGRASAATSSPRSSSPAASSHHSASSSRSPASSQRVACAVSSGWLDRPSRTMVSSTKSAPGSATSSARWAAGAACRARW